MHSVSYMHWLAIQILNPVVEWNVSVQYHVVGKLVGALYRVLHACWYVVYACLYVLWVYIVEVERYACG